jgi:aspartate carbamoyltransferase catalytic subunit
VDLFEKARHLRTRSTPVLTGKILVSLFYEPSTRTRLSFESAMSRLGGTCIGTDNAGEFSSAVKGETLEDTIRVASNYGDVIVLRHPKDDASDRAAEVSGVPIINAGAGKGQHPTQALLDLFTIEERFHKIDGLTIALVGDLANGRTIRSLAYLLGKYDDITIRFVSPPRLEVSNDILAYLDRHRVRHSCHDSLDEILDPVIDVCYLTRVQKERISGLSGLEAARLAGLYRMTPKLASRMRRDACIMHPLPRNDEIPREIDALPQALYFEQAKNGVLIRMALLASMLNG